jgi:purine-binding chemotaxis protein CheW
VDGELTVNVVVETDDGAVSLLVDEIGDVVTVTEQSLELPPETLRVATRLMIRGVYKLPDRLLLALNLERVLDTKAFEHTPPK